MLAVARLPMLYSDSLLCFCLLLIFQLAGFLLRPIGLYPGNSGLSREIFRAYLLRCALVYRHNDIIVLIIGKSNTAINSECLYDFVGLSRTLGRIIGVHGILVPFVRGPCWSFPMTLESII